MAFSSWDELINMSAKNPEQARSLVNKARIQGRTPVDANNPGYSQLSSTMPGKPSSVTKTSGNTSSNTGNMTAAQRRMLKRQKSTSDDEHDYR
jgi:hypothetical protein